MSNDLIINIATASKNQTSSSADMLSNTNSQSNQGLHVGNWLFKNMIKSFTNQKLQHLVQSQKSRVQFTQGSNSLEASPRNNPNQDVRVRAANIFRLRNIDLLYKAGSSLRPVQTYSNTDAQVYDRTIKMQQMNKALEGVNIKNAKSTIDKKRHIKRFLISAQRKEINTTQPLQGTPPSHTSSPQQVTAAVKQNDPRMLHQIYKEHRQKLKKKSIAEKIRNARVDQLGYSTITYNTLLNTPQSRQNVEKFLNSRAKSLGESSLQNDSQQLTFSQDTSKKRIILSKNNHQLPKIHNRLYRSIEDKRMKLMKLIDHSFSLLALDSQKDTVELILPQIQKGSLLSSGTDSHRAPTKMKSKMDHSNSVEQIRQDERDQSQKRIKAIMGSLNAKENNGTMREMTRNSGQAPLGFSNQKVHLTQPDKDSSQLDTPVGYHAIQQTSLKVKLPMTPVGTQNYGLLPKKPKKNQQNKGSAAHHLRSTSNPSSMDSLLQIRNFQES